MKGYLTYNRIINLITVYFYHNEWSDQSLDYIKEKYDRIFCCLPDKIKIIDNIIIFNDLTHKINITTFYSDLNNYTKKWHCNISNNDIMMLFTIYHIMTGYLNPDYLNKKYSDLFTTYDYINNRSQVYGLHELIKQTIRSIEEKYEKDFLPFKRVSKLMKIKKLIKKG